MAMLMAVIVLGCVLASVPFIGRNTLLAIPVLRRTKSTLILWLEFVLAYVVWLIIARGLEAQVGPVKTQAWAFYAITFLVFCTAAFPAFAYRYLWRKR